MLASMRLCANVPGQWAIQTALGGYQSINDLVAEGGRLRRQRDLAYELITKIPGVTCVKPKAALYMFPRSTRRCTRSRTTSSSFTNCCRNRRCCWCRAPASTGRAGPLPDRVPAARGRPARGHHPRRPLPESYRKRHGTA
jgi:hypothetical protein